jgi:methionyl-tRNA synthetase
MRSLITSALPYINGIKHLGNLTGSMLPADVHARFRRMIGDEVLFICATDEHGTPAEIAAIEANQNVKEYCDEQHTLQAKSYKDFNLSFDWFGRTSSDYNHKLTQHFCDSLEKNNLIEELETEQIYSIDEKRFLPDRYVEGTCPNCGYTSARGDQCDSCTKLLDPTQLINPHSKTSGSYNLEIRKTKHLFLKQDDVVDQLEDWVQNSDKWPPLAKSIANKWLKEGIKPRSITRDLDWGIPVLKNGEPREGFEDKVFYVWFDAPIGYISATQEWAKKNGKDWESWWHGSKGADDVEYTQFMGKDNVAFHTVSFPATLMGTKEDWKLVDKLKAFNWVNWYGDKFSTSQKRGVFLDQAVELLPADYWRWYLMSNAPEGNDLSFTWESFQATCNADLCNNFGNFVNRIVRYTESKFDSKVPEIDMDYIGEDEIKLIDDVTEKINLITEHHTNIEIRKAANETRALWSIGNEYLAKSAPWANIKENPKKAGTSVAIGLNLCVLISEINTPFIPETSKTILEAFGYNFETAKWPDKKINLWENGLEVSQPIGKLPILFQKLDDNWVEEQGLRFGSKTLAP